MRVGSRWRRLGLGSLTGACLLTGALSAPAGATLALTGGTNIAVDSDAHFFQNPQQTIWSNSTYQFVGSWDAVDGTTGEVYLQITRRRLSDNRIDTLRFDGRGSSPFAAILRVQYDGHNGLGLGVSPNDGRIHVSYSMHTSDRRNYYVYSDDACISEATFSFATCTFTRQFYMTSATARYTEDVNRGRRGDRLEDEMTYPNFFNDSRGRLYFSYRHDASARGVAVLNKYDDSAHTWSYVGDIVNGEDGDHRFDPDGAGPTGTVTARVRGAYSAWGFDKNDRLHMMWVWRENQLGVTGQHGVNYIYSDDYGTTWRNQAARQVLDTSGAYDPIVIGDLADTVVMSEPPGYYPMQPFFALDSNNNPHAIMGDSSLQTANIYDAEIRQTHFWRLTDGTWAKNYIEPVLTDHDEKNGRVFIDRADNLHYVYARTWTPFVPYNADPYVQAELPNENVTWPPDGSGGGYLNVEVDSANTFLWSEDQTLNIPIDVRGTNQVRVRMRNDTDNEDFAVAWSTDRAPISVNLQQIYTRGVRRRTGFTDYTFTITDSDWDGTLGMLELQPVSPSFTSGSVTFDWVRLTDSSGRVVKAWEFDQGRVLHAAEATQADNYATWTIESLGTGVSFPTDDASHWFDQARYDNARVVSFPWLYEGTPRSERLAIREYTITGDTILKDWRFDADLMGWTVDSDVTGLAWANDSGTKGMGGTISGANPSLLSQRNLDIPINGDGDWLHVVMKNTSAARRAGVWFQTNADRSWTAGKSKQFSITANSGYTEYDIDMSRVSGWDRSTLYLMSFEAVDDGTSSGSFAVDRIWIDDTR